MKLQNIGFYTLSDERARSCSPTSPLTRCELILTDKCNFKCPYCRGLRSDCVGTMSLIKAQTIVKLWTLDGLKNIRFSGGEPTLYKDLHVLVKQAKDDGVEHIAISTNGSQSLSEYEDLIYYGVNDFSISLDACCAAFGKKMSGGVDVWDKVVNNIREISKLTYVTVGIVFTEENVGQAKEIVEFAHELGVADIRVISSAQYNQALSGLFDLSDKIINKHPILNYRINNFKNEKNVRGMQKNDNHHCPLVLDDMAVAGDYHFPCIIYMREQGNPIGKVSLNMRQERYEWYKSHDCFEDKICQNNCLDVCIAYNNRVIGK